MADDNALSVSVAIEAANARLKSLGTLVVMGEVSGFTGPNARSGHCYFQVKDDGAAMDVIVWRGTYQKCGFELRDGLELQLKGRFDVYPNSGRLSFKASSLELAGEGLLRQKVAELARKLRAEGLMEQSRKRPVPVFCERVGVVTSLSGAVVDDVKRTLRRRNPLVALELSGCTVQGPGAPASIIAALNRAAATKPDAILLVRGGGSFEDLMTFNDETLARAVAACPVPVVTGIGHEPDTTICDMVSDFRASTPTAAAESVAPSLAEVVESIRGRRQRLAAALGRMVESGRTAVDHGGSRLLRAQATAMDRQRVQLESLGTRLGAQNPRQVVEGQRSTLELTADRLQGAMDRLLADRTRNLDATALRLHGAGPKAVQAHRREVEALGRTLTRDGATLTDSYRSRLGALAASLDALSPLKVLGRGYAIVSSAGHVVSSAADLAVGDTLTVGLAQGSVEAKVTAVEP